MKNLKISNDQPLPIDTVTQKVAWLGTTGSGKTYGASKLAEQMWDIKAQFVVLDPVGVWYGLRLQKDGKKPSHINIPIFGGLHGDVPLEPTAGELIANLVVDKGMACIIDVSQFESDADKTRFATAFADRLFFRKKSAPSAIHLFLEECQEFVPQNPQKGEERMLHAFIRMQKLGRNFGIGSSYITQRPQEVNKKALNMCQNLFVFRNTGTHERQAIEKWIEDKSLDETIAQDLPKIPTGNCHIWSPEFLKVSKMIKISEKETFNASATPEVGAIAKSRELAPIDLDQVREDMKATLEKAKADDPKLLKKKIAELEQMNTNLLKHPFQKDLSQDDAMKIAMPLLKAQEKIYNEERGNFIKHINTLMKVIETIGKEASKILEVKITTDMKKIEIFNMPVVVDPKRKEGDWELRNVGRRDNVQNVYKPEPVDGDVKIGKGEIAILKAIAQMEDGITREHLTVLTGYKRSSRDAYIQRLQAKGYIRAALGRLHASPEGIAFLGDDFEPLPTGMALQNHLMSTLPEGERKILELLIHAHNDNVDGVVSRDDISTMTGYQRSSRDAYIQRLKSRQLVESLPHGMVKASDKLF